MNTRKILPLSLLYACFFCVSALLAATGSAEQPNTFDVESFPVGNGPYSITSDGANIWVTNFLDDTVTKLRASDGVPLGTFSAGDDPSFITFDGTNIWVSNFLGDSVTKLRASDGTVLGTFAVVNSPRGIAYDGANIWVANRVSDSLTKLRPSDGTVLRTVRGVGTPQRLAFDGANIWASDGSNNVTAVRARHGKILGIFPVGDNHQTTGIAVGGGLVWTASYTFNTLEVLSKHSGAHRGTIAVGQAPEGVYFDGTSIWVANSSANSVNKITRTNQ